MLPPFLQFQLAVGEEIDESRASDKALKIALRAATDAFGAAAGCIARRVPGEERLTPVVRLPRPCHWDYAELARYTGERRPPMPEGVLVVPIERRKRPWGVLALRVDGGTVPSATAREALKVGRRISRALERVDRTRLSEVRERIDRKVLEQVRPRDLFYHVLHGLHSLARYDHSAAVLMMRNEPRQLQVVAEQVAWRPGGSSMVGFARPLHSTARELLERGEVLGFDRRADGGWKPWSGEQLDVATFEAAQAVADALDYNRATGIGDEQTEGGLLAAPLVGPDGLQGVLKVACRFPGFLGDYEGVWLGRFLPQVALALGNLERAATYESGAVAAERRSALADLARGVAHDVNNALGAALPLVQQLRADLSDGILDAPTAAQDLVQIEASLGVCRRIFGGMLSLARSAAHGSSDGNLRRATENAVLVLGDSCRRQRVELVVQLPDRVPPVRCPQHDLEQLLLNLASNARDAMPDGGTLVLSARREARSLEVEVRDSGSGIASGIRTRVEEPFFSTKPGGHGLGLAIVRAIVTRCGGRFVLEAVPSGGTVARLSLPLAAPGRLDTDLAGPER